MTPNPERVRANDTLATAINKLFELDVRHLPVVNGNDELVGILSDRDLRSYALAGSIEYQGAANVSPGNSTAVSSVMQGDVISLGTDDDVIEAISLMIDQKIGAIPIVDPIEGGLVGIVSYIDVLRLAEERLS